MLNNKTSDQEKRKKFKQELNSGKLLRFPGSISPYVSMMIEKIGFDGVYISGAVLSNDLGLPDIGLTTLSEVSHRGGQIARTTNLPTIIDMDTGFGEAMNAARTIQELERAGICATHIEDQVNPKRCGHLDNKEIISSEKMIQKIKAAKDACTDENFILIARSDAKAIEGLDKTIDRMKAYVDAGADMIFPEALHTQQEFEQVRKAISVPLLANMTEFGKSKLLSTEELTNLGYNLVIYPVTTFRIAMGAVERGLKNILNDGIQTKEIDNMQTRKELYEYLEYEKYNQFDSKLFNFKVAEKGDPKP